jgi:hypothetical protein
MGNQVPKIPQKTELVQQQRYAYVQLGGSNLVLED